MKMTATGVRSADPIFRKVSLHLLPILIMCYVLAYIDRQNVGFAKLQFMGSLHFSEAVYGLGGGLFYLGYSLFEIPSNLILQKIGARATMLRIMIGWGTCATLFAFMISPLHFYVLRSLLGIAEAGLFPGILLFISFWIPPSRRATFTAMFMAAMPISGIVGGPISGAILGGMGHLGGLAGWQWMFILEGIPSIVMAIVVYLVLADTPAQARWLSATEKAALSAELEAESRGKARGAHHNFATALRDPRFYGVAGMSVSLLAGIAGFQLWMPTIIRAAGAKDLSEVGVLAAVPSIVAIIVQQYIARRSDRVMERRWHAALPTLAAALGFALLPLCQSNLIAAMACLIVVGAGLVGSTGPYWTLPSSQLSGSAAAGGIALITTIGGLASFLSASLVGALNKATGSANAGLYYFAALATFGPILMLLATRPASKDRMNGLQS